MLGVYFKQGKKYQVLI